MLFKIFSLILASLLMAHNSFAEIASPDNTFIEGDQYASNFASKLNRNFVQLTNSVNNIRGLFAGSLQTAGQIGLDTIGIDNMAPEADPAIRLTENFREYVEDGLQPATDSDLTSDISAGTAYPEGYRVDKTSATAHTYTASRDTYVDIDKNGDFQFSEVALGAAAPAITTNSVRLARASTDGTAIRSVTDLRVLTLVDEQQSEAVDGFKLTYSSGDSFTVTAGRARDRSNNFSLSTSSTTTVDIDTSGLNGIDTGSKAAGTWYYLHIVGAADGGQTVGFLLSTSSTTPTFPTNYDRNRRIGALRTNASFPTFHSFDQYGIGSVRQYQYRERQNAAAYSAANLSGAYQTVDLSTLIPDTVSRLAKLSFFIDDNNTNGTLNIRTAAYSGVPGAYEFGVVASPQDENFNFEMIVDSNGQFQWTHPTTNITADIDVSGYVDEV